MATPTKEQLAERAVYLRGVKDERAAVAAWLRATGREMDARYVERGGHRTGEAC